MVVRKGIALMFSLLGLALFAPPASADFHLIKIREVAPNPAGAQSAFIELQMYSPGQTQLAGHSVRVYDAGGLPMPATFALSGTTQNGENQRTYLIGDDNTAPAPDFLNQQLQDFLFGPGGAVCFDTIDCVAWGNFTGTGLPSPPGPPGPAIPDGSSLTRSIAPGCATLLEDSDDTNNSAADFALGTPSPRNNATAPTETACGPGGGPGPGGGDTNPPETSITKAPKRKSAKGRVKISFEANEPGSKFRCKLDKGQFGSCASPFKSKVKLGKHSFQVYAIDDAGNEDKSPAKAKFRRIEKR